MRRLKPLVSDRHPTDAVVLGVVRKKASIGLEVSMQTIALGDGTSTRAVTLREVRRGGDGWIACEHFRGITIRAAMFDEVRALLDQAGAALADENPPPSPPASPRAPR